ncbi:MAG TPA: trimethylamine methyltransferase family protein [Anaerolineae bacterium]|nr:trimethylamine methyltransferase family protein [Anaerolineae bacterium]
MTQQTEVTTLHPKLQVLSEEQILEIHHSSLDILSETGIVIQNEEGRRLLLEGGASESEDRIKIPPHLVTDAVASAPSRIPMYDRLGEMVMPLQEGKVFFGSGSDCMFTVDVETGHRRKSTAEDAQRMAHLCDGLDQIDFVMSMATPADVEARDAHIHGFVGMIRGSVKPNVYTASGRKDMEDIHRIACAVAGGEEKLRERPFLLLYAQPISPLLFADESVDKLLFCAEKGIPACYPPSTNTGGGGPITLAGALALGNAESLVGLVLTQLAQRGTPYVYGMNTSTLDMRSTIVSYGSPEWSLSMAASTDIAEYYGLPSWGFAGATDSKVVDAQAGIDASISIMTALLARCNLVHDVGYIEYGNTSSMEMLVVADEIIGEVRFLMNGVPVNEVTLAREAIARARPGGGFLADDHTLDNWEWAQWRPTLIDRTRYEQWVEKGSKDIAARANERARQILDKHEVPPLAEAAEEEIARVLAERGTEDT